jgi:hypothetical protein
MTIIKRESTVMGHTRTSDLHWLSVLSIGSEGRLVIFSRQRRPDRTVGEEPFVYAPFSGRQIPLTLGYPILICKGLPEVFNREGNASGRLKGEEPFPSIISQGNLCPSVHHSLLFSFIVPFPFFVLWYLCHRCAVFPLSRNSGCSVAHGSNG